MVRKKKLLSLLLALATVLSLTAPAAAAIVPRDPLEYPVDTTVSSTGTHYHYVNTEVSKGFAVNSLVLRGDADGKPNWDSGLTRMEAAIMVLRLMGLEEEAAAAAARPCPFTDVPGWAAGYATLAYEKGVSGGVGGGCFGPNDPCSVQDFTTMLFRLTNLTEGRDYSWATALDDFLEAARQLYNYKGSGWLHFSLAGNSGMLNVKRYYDAGGLLTRAAAADILYFMLSIKAGPDDESLGDILAYRYGMSDMLLFDHYIRRTAWNIDGRYSYTKSYGTDLTDYAYLYAWQSESHWEKVRTPSRFDKWKDSYITPDIQALAAQLTAGKTTELAKAEAICTWISTHIYYDYDVARNTSTYTMSSASETLQDRRGICEEICVLTQAMLRAAGLECYTESGSDQKSRGHAWNMVYADGKWVAVDNTWESNYMKLRYEYTPGSGYMYGSTVPANYLEPQPVYPSNEKHWNFMELDEFYSTHVLRPEPLIMTRYSISVPQTFD